MYGIKPLWKAISDRMVRDHLELLIHEEHQGPMQFEQ